MEAWLMDHSIMKILQVKHSQPGMFFIAASLTCATVASMAAFISSFFTKRQRRFLIWWVLSWMDSAAAGKVFSIVWWSQRRLSVEQRAWRK